MEDLPRHLDGRDDRGQSFVKKDDVLWSIRTVERRLPRNGTYCGGASSVRGTLDSDTTVGLFPNSDISKIQRREAIGPYPLERWRIVDT
jgi:hypothetical protein